MNINEINMNTAPSPADNLHATTNSIAATTNTIITSVNTTMTTTANGPIQNSIQNSNVQPIKRLSEVPYELQSVSGKTVKKYNFQHLLPGTRIVMPNRDGGYSFIIGNTIEETFVNIQQAEAARPKNPSIFKSHIDEYPEGTSEYSSPVVLIRNRKPRINTNLEATNETELNIVPRRIRLRDAEMERPNRHQPSAEPVRQFIDLTLDQQTVQQPVDQPIVDPPVDEPVINPSAVEPIAQQPVQQIFIPQPAVARPPRSSILNFIFARCSGFVRHAPGICYLVGRIRESFPVTLAETIEAVMAFVQWFAPGPPATLFEGPMLLAISYH